MAPKLSKIQRTELENIIISKLQGVEVMTDKEIANTIVPCTTRAIRTARAKILKDGRIDGNRKTGRPREVTEHNVFDKRVAQTNEWPTSHHLITTILNFHTTTLRTNDNYIRNS